MAIALVIGTILLFLEVNGLSLHPSTGTVTQNGLVFIDAHPESATAYLNGQQKGNTDLRLVLPTGDYNLELKRDGYRTWKHTFTLEGSSIERLVYPFLFPEKLVSKDVQLYAAPPALATESPDRHWLIVQQAGNLTSFDIVDISNTNGNATTATLPPGLLKTGGTKHVLELVEWSTDNRHVLIKHTYDTGTEFVIYDRETPASSINLNQALGRPIADIALRDKKYDQYYLLDAIGGSLVSMDLKNKQVVPIGGSILAFKSHGPDVLLLVTTEGAPAGEVLVKV
ncbi:MAG TPA: PEGA domain-containing protein, partial [Candidatus Saccharimonadales bacterium]|nr:PEGA domain-containing protein [Candidatus Saccharimonadales bacterium]